MGFNLSAFVGGFTEASAESMKEKRERAELLGAEAVKSMSTNYKKVIEENKKKEAEIVSNIRTLKMYDPSATEDQVFSVANSPELMAAIVDNVKKPDFDATGFKIGNFAKVAESNVPSTAMERTKALFKLPEIVKTATQESAPSGNIYKDFLSRGVPKAQEAAMLKQAQALGVPLEQLQAAAQYERVGVPAPEVDMTKLRPEKTFTQQENDAKLALLKAKEVGNPAAIEAAAKRAANVVATNSEFSLSGKSEERIQSDMVNEIQRKAAAGDNQGASVTAALLRQRQALLSKPKDPSVKTDADKISQANLLTTAARTISQTVEMMLPPGSFLTTVDASGNVKTELREFAQSDRYKQGIQVAQEQLISQFTDKDGRPLSKMHANALMASAIKINKDGIAELPVLAPAPSPAPTTPRPSGRLGSAPSGRQQAVAQPAAPAPAASAQGQPVLRYNPTTGKWE